MKIKFRLLSVLALALVTFSACEDQLETEVIPTPVVIESQDSTVQGGNHSIEDDRP